MTINTYIVDDEPHATEILQKYISRTPGLVLQGCSRNPLEALPEITGNHPPQLTFLDIDMPQLSGVALAGLIGQHTRIVFTTSFREYGAEAFEQNAVDYLLKPFSHERFLAAIQKFRSLTLVKERTPVHDDGGFFVSSGVRGKLIRVLPEELFYLEGAQNFIRLHLARENLLVYLTLQEILEQLPAGEFLRIHKSFIVSRRKIKAIEGGQVRLENGILLPVGRTFHEQFLQQLEGKIINTKRDHPG